MSLLTLAVLFTGPPAFAAPVDVLDNILGTNYVVTVWEDAPTVNHIRVCTIDIGVGYSPATYADFKAGLLLIEDPAPESCGFEPSSTVDDIIILGVERI